MMYVFLLPFLSLPEINLHALTALAALKQAQSQYNEAIEMYEHALPIARESKESHSRVWLANHVAAYAETLRKSGKIFFGVTVGPLIYFSLSVDFDLLTYTDIAALATFCITNR